MSDDELVHHHRVDGDGLGHHSLDRRQGETASEVGEVIVRQLVDGSGLETRSGQEQGTDHGALILDRAINLGGGHPAPPIGSSICAG